MDIKEVEDVGARKISKPSAYADFPSQLANQTVHNLRCTEMEVLTQISVIWISTDYT